MKKFLKFVKSTSLVLMVVIAFLGPFLIQLHWGYVYELALHITPGDHSSWLNFWGSYLGIIISVAMAFIVVKMESNQSKKLAMMNSINEINISDLREVKSLLNKYPYSGEVPEIFQMKDYLNIGVIDTDVERIKKKLIYSGTSDSSIAEYAPRKIWSISKTMMPGLYERIEPRANILCEKLDVLSEFTIEEFKKYTDEYQILLEEKILLATQKSMTKKGIILKKNGFPVVIDILMR